MNPIMLLQTSTLSVIKGRSGLIGPHAEHVGLFQKYGDIVQPIASSESEIQDKRTLATFPTSSTEMSAT